jgi:hypothetical protein
MDTDFALFQMNSSWSKWPVSEEENMQLILQSLTALTAADYFMKSFYRRVTKHKIPDLPSMSFLQIILWSAHPISELRFNSEGAFVGVVNAGNILLVPTMGPDHRSLTN